MVDITVGYIPELSLKLPVLNSRELRARPYRQGGANREDAKLKKVSQDFESIFLVYLLREMRKTIPKSGFLDGGVANDIFREILDEKLAGEVAKSGGIGLGELLYEQLRNDSRVKKESLKAASPSPIKIVAGNRGWQ